MSVIVTKFGGTSLANASQIKKVRDILLADPRRRHVVVSAPGKRDPSDRKITDLLYVCHAHVEQRLPFDDIFKIISDRYRQIISDLKVTLPIDEYLDEIRRGIETEKSAEFAASRGEYLMAVIMAAYLDWDFIDAATVVRFSDQGEYDRDTTAGALKARLADTEHAVVPGFYGAMSDGRVKTFRRGGSDLTGAIVAAAARAEEYENWTDVSGLMMANPSIIPDARVISNVTYAELRELAYMGVCVVQEDALFAARAADLHIRIRNTNRPDDPGTLIGAEFPLQNDPAAGMPTGVAGRKDFMVIVIEKAFMNEEVGFGRRVLTVLENNGIRFEHMPSGIDTLSVVIEEKQLQGRLVKVCREIEELCKPDRIDYEHRIALVATVGRGMARRPGTAAKLFGALAAADINVHMIDQGSSEINIIVGVATEQFEAAIRAIYGAFVS